MSIRYERNVKVTPAMAYNWLRLNSENNRMPKTGKIPNYARDMLAGRWQSDTAESIKFDTQGTLIDGQNRLRALVLAGEKDYNLVIEFDVAYDVPEEAMQVIDSGSSRTFSDVLIISGAGSARMQVSSIIRWDMQWESGIFTGRGGMNAPTNSEMLERFHQFPALYTAAAARARDAQARGLGTASAAGMAYVLFERLDHDQNQQFFDHLMTGANLPDLHPVLTLRNRIMRSRIDRITRPEQLALFIRAWNAFRAGKELRSIVITNSGELTNLNFPMPK